MDKKQQMEIDNHFMRIAMLEGKLSKENFKVGACVVDKNGHIAGLGHNKIMFVELHKKAVECKGHSLERYLYIDLAVEAALNGPQDYSECTVYLTSYPSPHCVKEIVRKGIKRLVHYNDKREKLEKNMYETSNDMLKEAAGLEISQFYEKADISTDVDICADEHKNIMTEDDLTFKIRELVKLDVKNSRQISVDLH